MVWSDHKCNKKLSLKLIFSPPLKAAASIPEWYLWGGHESRSIHRPHKFSMTWLIFELFLRGRVSVQAALYGREMYWSLIDFNSNLLSPAGSESAASWGRCEVWLRWWIEILGFVADWHWHAAHCLWWHPVQFCQKSESRASWDLDQSDWRPIKAAAQFQTTTN